MAEPATLPSIEEIERASAFTREPFLTEGEDAASALAPGTPRRRALDSALVELEAGAKVPSPHWRRQWSLLLGLDRLLSQEEPHLVDGTVLSAHQVDALSGTLTALLADRLKNGDTPRSRRRPPMPVLDADDVPTTRTTRTRTSPRSRRSGPRTRPRHEDIAEAPEDPNAGKRFWFEHATGAGKTVAAVGFVEASRTGGVLILTHRRNLVDQFNGELRDRGYAKRIAPALLGHEDTANGPVTVETYQWFVRNAGNISDAYSIVICDEAHTALGEKTSAAIRAWTGPVFVGMTATGALIARHVTDLFPTQTSRFDLAQAARRGVISPLRCVRIPPGPGVRTIAKVPLRRGEVDTEFDQEMLAELLDQLPFNLAIADLYKTRFNGVPGRRLRRRRAPRLQRRAGLPRRRDEGAGRLGRDAQARAGADPGPLRGAATSTCWSTRSCWPRAGTRRARRSACTSRRRPPSASTSSASAASRVATRARRPASSSTSCIRRPSTTTRS